ncbi:MAG: hypothetical protein LBQ22_08205 [Bacteroidales bacterium]|jgi:hypothetical protein|nr:hypothetical protein [Bacteroidales bacterium]
MNKKIFIFLVVSIIISLLFTGCLKDTKKPVIQLYGVNQIPIKSAPEGQYDTVILLYSRYTDPEPPVWVEDNKSLSEDIIVTSDIEEILNVSRNNWYVTRTGDLAITYTAVDEDNNSNSIQRKMRVANVSEAYSPANDRTTYQLMSRESHTIPFTSYTMNVTTDSRVAGVIRLPRVYSHEENGESVSYNISAYLYSDELSQRVSTTIGYMGHKSNPDKPFFEVYDDFGHHVRNLSHKEAMDTLVSATSPLRITELKIEDQIVYTDPSDETKYVRIKPHNAGTRSTIEYLGNEPYKITIAFSVEDRRGATYITDDVIEKYDKVYLEDIQ